MSIRRGNKPANSARHRLRLFDAKLGHLREMPVPGAGVGVGAIPISVSIGVGVDVGVALMWASIPMWASMSNWALVSMRASALPGPLLGKRFGVAAPTVFLAQVGRGREIVSSTSTAVPIAWYQFVDTFGGELGKTR